MGSIIKENSPYIPRLIGIYFAEPYKRFDRGTIINLSQDYNISKTPQGNEFSEFDTSNSIDLYVEEELGAIVLNIEKTFKDTFGRVLSNAIEGYSNNISTRAIIGDNGAGKSTILELIEGFYKTVSRKIIADSINELREGLGYVNSIIPGIVFIIVCKDIKGKIRHKLVNLTRTQGILSSKNELKSIILENYDLLGSVLTDHLHICKNKEDAVPVINLRLPNFSRKSGRENIIPYWNSLTIFLFNLIKEDNVETFFPNNEEANLLNGYFLTIYQYLIENKIPKESIIFFFLFYHLGSFEYVSRKDLKYDPQSEEYKQVILAHQITIDIYKEIAQKHKSTEYNDIISKLLSLINAYQDSQITISEVESRKGSDRLAINMKVPLSPELKLPNMYKFIFEIIPKHLVNDLKVRSILEYNLTIPIATFLNNLTNIENNETKKDLLKAIKNHWLFTVNVKLQTPSGIHYLDSLSSGEKQMILLFSRIKNNISSYYENPIKDEENQKTLPHLILLLDEPENSLHLEWQRKFIYMFLSNLSYFIKSYNVEYISIFIATHSPFIIGDIHKDNIVFLSRKVSEGDIASFSLVKDRDSLAKDSKILIDNTFLGNIPELIKGAFFLSKPYGELGERFLENVAKNKQFTPEELKAICGDDYLMEYLLMKFK